MSGGSFVSCPAAPVPGQTFEVTFRFPAHCQPLTRRRTARRSGSPRPSRARSKAWKNPEFSLLAPGEPGDDGQETRFHVEKLLVPDGYEIYEELREAVSVLLREIRKDGALPFSLLSIIIGIPRPVLSRVKARIYAEITIQPPGGKDMIPLLANQGLAFRSVEQMYEVLGRGLVVNFSEFARAPRLRLAPPSRYEATEYRILPAFIAGPVDRRTRPPDGPEATAPERGAAGHASRHARLHDILLKRAHDSAKATEAAKKSGKGHG